MIPEPFRIQLVCADRWRGSSPLLGGLKLALIAWSVACTSRDAAEQAKASYSPVPVVSGALRVTPQPEFLRPAPVVLPQSGSMARTAALGPGNRVAFIDDLGSEVLLSVLGDSAASLVGRTGAGPGEYSRVTRIASCGELGFAVADIGNNRILYFGWNGKFIRAVQAVYRIAGISCGDRGTTLALEQPGPLPQFGASDADVETTLHFWTWDESLADSMPRIDAGEFRILGSAHQFTMVDHMIVLGTGRSASLRLTEVGTRSSETVRAGIGGRPATREVFDAAIDRLVSGLSEESERQRWKSEFERLPMPPRIPAYFQVESDGDRFLWVVTSPPGVDSAVIDVIDSRSGEQAGSVRFAGQPQLVAVGRKHLLLRTEDLASGEEWLLAYAWSVK